MAGGECPDRDRGGEDPRKLRVPEHRGEPLRPGAVDRRPHPILIAEEPLGRPNVVGKLIGHQRQHDDQADEADRGGPAEDPPAARADVEQHQRERKELQPDRDGQ